MKIPKFAPNTRVVITTGVFKGSRGIITGYRDASHTYSIQLEGESPDVGWAENEFRQVELADEFAASPQLAEEECEA
jgi:hypothetical protein